MSTDPAEIGAAVVELREWVATTPELQRKLKELASARSSFYQHLEWWAEDGLPKLDRKHPDGDAPDLIDQISFARTRMAELREKIGLEGA